MIETNIFIIGAGPIGLFTVFELDLPRVRCHVIDTWPLKYTTLSGIPAFDATRKQTGKQ